ncbi:MAG TPA: nucleotidyltransferase domain-containing protein [Anaerolineae bacterium]|nr:nucleotidyltransferase domain-containing protein [Anaerolineae bacterium]
MHQSPQIAADLLADLEKLAPLFQKHSRVLGVFLFGSHVEGYATPQSDVDLAILYEGEVDWREHARLAEAIAQQLHRKVDVADARRLPLTLQNRVIRGRIIYEKDPDQVSDFVQRVLVRYFDFQPRLRTFNRDFDQAMEETYGRG